MMNTKNYIDRDEVINIINVTSLEKLKIELTSTLYISEADVNSLYTVGCTMEEKFFKVPSIGIKILNHINDNRDLKDLDLNEDVDIKDFIKNITIMGLVIRINDICVEKDTPEIEEKIGLKMNSKFFHKPYTNLIFNKLTFTLASMVMLMSLYFTYIQYVNYGIGIIPNVEVLFSLPNLLFLVLILYISDIIFGLYHETAHVLTARHFGIKNININLGRRLVHLVYQTRISNVWTLSKNQRTLLYTSGILADIFLICIMIILGHLFLYNNFDLLFSISRVLILTLILGILFELKVYMRTDVYYLISDKLDKPNLHQDSIRILKNFNREWKKSDSKLKFYFVIMIVSSLIEVYVFINFLLPFLILSIKEIIDIYENHSNITLNEWGTLLGFIFIIFELLLLMTLFIRERYADKHTKHNF